MSNKIKVPKSHPPLVPHWMVTFSDMRVVLLCFFVLLSGFSGTTKGDYGKGPGALVGYPGVVPTANSFSDGILERPDMAGGRIQLNGYESPSENDPLSTVFAGLDVKVRESVMSNALQYRLTDKGFEIEILCGTLFEDNTADLKGGSDPNRILGVIADACRNLPHQVRVQAYADDLFVPTEEFATEEALAFRRAALVCECLHVQARLPLEHLSIATKVLPRSSAWSPERLSQVTITVLPKWVRQQ